MVIYSSVVSGGIYMWDRISIKTYAKDFLRKHYWKAFLVVLVVTILSGGTGNSSNNKNQNHMPEHMFGETINIPGNFDSPSFITNLGSRITKSPLFFLGTGLHMLTLIFIAIIMFTVGFAVEVGQARFFLDGFKGDVNMRKLFSVFNKNEYVSVVVTQFIRFIYNFLWFFVLIIPGIIKSYEYRFVPHILAEQPNLPSSEVITLSRNMTRGHKFDMFVLDLSFIGWYLLGLLAFGLGVYFVNPYVQTTNARLYNILSKESEVNDYY